MATSWIQQAIFPGFPVHTVYALTSDIVWCVGLETFLTTDDSGNTWTNKSSARPVHIMIQCCIAYSNLIGLVGGSNANPGQQKMYKTIDGGDNWIPVSVSVNEDWKQFAYDLSTGNTYVISDTVLRKSLDDGENWTTITSYTGFTGGVVLSGLAVMPNNKIILCGSNTTLMISDSGINNWVTMQLSLVTSDFKSIAAASDGTIWVVGTNKTLLTLPAGGYIWIDKSSMLGAPWISSDTINSVTVNADGNFIAVSGPFAGGVYSSNDGGTTWIWSEVDPNTMISTVATINPTWAIDPFAGRIFRSPTPLPPDPPDPPICFTGDAIVETDQGPTCFVDMRRDFTINGNAIRKVLSTTNKSGGMILIKKGALDINIPNKDTYITPRHRVVVDGARKHAWDLVNGDTIIDYNIGRNKTVYNILLNESDKIPLIQVNGMTAETMDPGLCKLYRKPGKLPMKFR